MLPSCLEALRTVSSHAKGQSSCDRPRDIQVQGRRKNIIESNTVKVSTVCMTTGPSALQVLER